MITKNNLSLNMLFSLEKEDTITNDNNGKYSVRKSSYRKKARIDNRKEYFKTEVEPLGLPEANECLLIKSNGLSDTGAIFQYILEKEKCNTLYLATWIISKDNIDEIINALKSGRLQKFVFVVSIRLKQLKKSVYAYLVEQFNQFPDQIYYKVCNSHAKTFSISTEKNFYTVIGSGNWTQNPRIENYIIHNDKNIFEFNKQWMEELTII
jgi:hypothetical protein